MPGFFLTSVFARAIGVVNQSGRWAMAGCYRLTLTTVEVAGEAVVADDVGAIGPEVHPGNIAEAKRCCR